MSETLENLYSETRQFPPPEALAADANVKADAYEQAKADRIGFWEQQARRLSWAKEWDQAVDAWWVDVIEPNAYEAQDAPATGPR